MVSVKGLHDTNQPTRLRSFVEDLVPSQNDYGKFMNTRTGGKIYELIGNETYAEPTVATLFWQIYIQSLPKLKPVFGVYDEYIVVSHGQGQYSLLILDNFHYGEPQVQIIDSSETKSELDL